MVSRPIAGQFQTNDVAHRPMTALDAANGTVIQTLSHYWEEPRFTGRVSTIGFLDSVYRSFEAQKLLDFVGFDDEDAIAIHAD
jgi:hypothetical protein